MRLLSSITSLDETASLLTNNNIFSSQVKSSLVKLETSRTTENSSPNDECSLVSVCDCRWVCEEEKNEQCDQIGWFIGIGATYHCLWQQLVCPNLSHS